MTSRTTVLAVVIGLALFALVGLLCATYLIDQGKDAALVALIATPMGVALGGLTGLLASTRSTLGPNDTEPSTFQATVVRPPAPEAYDIAVEQTKP